MQWVDKRVVVTGGAGFLGSFVVEKLRERGCQHLLVPRSKEHDLRDRDAIIRLYKEFRPHVVIHLAGVVGGIGANRSNPGRFFYDNAIMGIELIEYARQFNVQKFVTIGTICAYPKFTPIPFKEEDLWNGYPEETNAPYGLAKKMALIRKYAEAQESGRHEIVLWGDGSPTREFLYVEDAAEAILLATEHYDGSAPVNLGTGEEITIRDLATMIGSELGYPGEIVWDRTKPNGQPRRCVDVSRAQQMFGFRAAHSLREGIAKTVAWFLTHRAELREVSFQLMSGQE